MVVIRTLSGRDVAEKTEVPQIMVGFCANCANRVVIRSVVVGCCAVLRLASVVCSSARAKSIGNAVLCVVVMLHTVGLLDVVVGPVVVVIVLFATIM